MTAGLLVASALVTFLAIIVLCRYCYIHILVIIATVLNIFLCGVIVIWVHVKLSCRHHTSVGAQQAFKQIESLRHSVLRDFENTVSPKVVCSDSNQFTPIFGRTVDSLLQQLLHFTVRDYVVVHFRSYAFDCDLHEENIKENLWSALQLLHERLSKIDATSLIACDIIRRVTYHFERIRKAKSDSFENSDLPPVVHLSAHVLSTEQEYKYLQRFSELLIMFLLPRSYSLTPTKFLLREILTSKVLQPFVDVITDPDFFNRHLVNYIESQRMTMNVHVRAFEHARTFDEIVRIIEHTDDVETLKAIRYNLVTRIMQATTLQNLNRSKGVDLDNEKGLMSSLGVQKSDINAAKKLHKYIGQLTWAKNECEKRLEMLGWDFGFQYSDDASKKSLSISAVLDHVQGRKFLSQFLETLASQDLVRFWSAVEELRNSQQKNWHQLGAEIFYTFIRNPKSEIKVDKVRRKRIEAFLLGDKGPEVFYEIQTNVVLILEEKYYQSFLISDHYKAMLTAMEKENEILSCSFNEDDEVKDVNSLDPNTTNKLQQSPHTLGNGGTGLGLSANSDVQLNVGDHSNYAKHKLDQLEERLNNKMQALEALRRSLKPESKVLTRLEREVDWLHGERRQLEAHLTRTEIWSDNLGRWRAMVQSSEMTDDKESLQFVLVVHMVVEDSIQQSESGIYIDDEDAGISTGWVVCRTLQQFQELNRILRPMCTELRNAELPSNTFKFRFSKADRVSLDKARMQVQKYLDFVLTDDKLNQSEALYSFLSPSSDHLKKSTVSPTSKKSKFSFSQMFRSTSVGSTGRQGSGGPLILSPSNNQPCANFDMLQRDNHLSVSGHNGGDETDDATSMSGISASEPSSNGGRDSIAEPLYALLGELFDMHGVFKYLRKTLIGFVQVTYGRNINRQIKETIKWWFSEQMLHYYVALILKNFWPGGIMAPPLAYRGLQEKRATATQARTLLVENVPELVCTLVGTSAGRNGARKLFDALQQKQLNKQLLYEIFEIVSDAAFPELS